MPTDEWFNLNTGSARVRVETLEHLRSYCDERGVAQGVGISDALEAFFCTKSVLPSDEKSLERLRRFSLHLGVSPEEVMALALASLEKKLSREIDD